MLSAQAAPVIGDRLHDEEASRMHHDAPPNEIEGAKNALASSIGNQVRELRLRKGWSQRRLAHAAGIAQQNLSLYERGLASPRLETLGRLLDALGARVRIELVAVQPAIDAPVSEPAREPLVSSGASCLPT